MKSLNLKPLVIALFSFHAFLFLAYYLWLGFYNRMGQDETLTLYILRIFGHNPIKAAYFELLTVEGMYSSLFLQTLIFNIIWYHNQIILYHVLMISIIIYCMFRFLGVAGNWDSFKHPNRVRLLLAVYLVSAFFFLSLLKSETWFWPTNIIEYTLPCAVFVLTIALIFEKKMIAACVMAFIVAGFRINYTGIFLFLGGLAIIYAFLKDKSLFDKMLLPYLFLMAGAILYLLAPGNYMRMKSLNIGITAEHAEAALKNNANFIITRFLQFKRVFFLLVFAAPVMFIGYCSEGKYGSPGIALKRAALVFAFLIASIIIINSVIYFFAIGMGTGGVPRVWEFGSFFLLMGVVYIFYLLGVYMRGNPGISPVYLNIVCCVLLIYSCSLYIKSYPQIKIARAYAFARDERIAQILKDRIVFEANRDTVIRYKPLPEQSITNYCDFSPDPDNGVNIQYQLGYDLNFKVARKKE